MTADASYDAPTYQRARADGFSARQALALARWIAAPKIDVPDYGAPVTIERDGFTVRLSVDYETGLDMADLGYGTVERGREDWRTGYYRPETPGAVPLPDSYRDDRGPFGRDARFYVPNIPLAERIEYARKAGASRSVALDIARDGIAAEIEGAWGSGYGPTVYVLTATVSREGITLGSASVGGIEIAWSDITRTDGREYLAEVAEDIIPEAIEDAQAALERLVTA